jgi:hypothetical protein
MRNRVAKNPQSRMNRAIARQSSSIVVIHDPACHAGGRGFESRRSPKIPAKRLLLIATRAAEDRRLRAIPRLSRTGPPQRASRSRKYPYAGRSATTTGGWAADPLAQDETSPPPSRREYDAGRPTGGSRLRESSATRRVLSPYVLRPDRGGGLSREMMQPSRRIPRPRSLRYGCTRRIRPPSVSASQSEPSPYATKNPG